MADEKKAQEGAKQESKPQNKVIAWLKALPKRIATPFKNMVNELKRVTWPSKQKLIRYSIIVLVFVLIMMLIIGLFDFGSARLVNALHISKTAETTQAAANAAETVADSGETAPEATAEENGEAAPEANAEENGETAPEANAEDNGETAPEADAENSGETAPEADAENSGETALRETSAPVNNEGN